MVMRAAGAGIEALSRRGKRRAAARDRADETRAVILQSASRVGSTDDVRGIIELLDQVDRRQHRRRLVRRVTALAGVAAVGVAAAIVVPKVAAELPHSITNTQIEVQNALYSVVQRNDPILLTGTGTGQASMKMQQEECAFGGCIGIPGTGENASSTVQANLDVILRSGNVALQAVRNGNGKPGYHILATINTAGFTDQLSQEQVQTSGNPQTIPSLFMAFGLDGNGNNANHDLTTAIALGNFQASCASPLKAAIPAALANSVQQDVREAAGLVQGVYPQAYRFLEGLATQPVSLDLMYDDRAGDRPVHVTPADISLPVPGFTGNSDQHVAIPGGVLAGTTFDAQLAVAKNSCMLSPGAAAELDKIALGRDFVLVP